MFEQSTVTYPALGLAVFARQLCLPVPALLFLISAGGMAHQAGLSVPLILFVSVAGCLAGDMVWFEAGRFWGKRILRVFTGLSLDPRRSRERAMTVFATYGLPSLLVAKFVPGLDGISPPLAGMEGVPRLRFVFFDALGSLLWSSFYVVLGLSFAGSVHRVLDLLSHSSRVLVLIVAVPCIVWVLWRGIKMLRMVLHLKTRRISPTLLNRRLKEKPESTVVIDLLDFQDDGPGGPGITGAIRLDPARLRTQNVVVAREDIWFVLYCSRASQYRSARIALELRRRGIEDVWVLEGGLNSWVEAGFPVTDQLTTEDEAIQKFGLTPTGGYSRMWHGRMLHGSSHLPPGEL